MKRNAILFLYLPLPTSHLFRVRVMDRREKYPRWKNVRLEGLQSPLEHINILLPTPFPASVDKRLLILKAAVFTLLRDCLEMESSTYARVVCVADMPNYHDIITAPIWKLIKSQILCGKAGFGGVMLNLRWQ